MTTEPITTAVAVVGVGAILPDAPDAETFWANVRGGRYSITDVDPERWDPAFYYDANPKAPDKTYSKIGGWVRDWTWDPLAWKLPIPPRVAASMDDAQKWAVACTRAALLDYGWPDRPFDGERTAVVLGNAMSGERHYLTALRIAYPELAHELDQAPAFQALPSDVRKAISAEFGELIAERYPEITEDTMPGELGNCMAGRVANLFDLHGPNYVVDAACASALAAIDSSVAGLIDHDYDIAIAGGVDRNMGASSYVKFCKIGALSATGTRPFDAGADGFVMGEGAGVFLLKRLADAERDGDRIYAVLRGIGGASDGRGKGITAPNPVGQRLAVERAWRNAGISPASCGMVECHGTSTRVGDVVEVTSIGEVFSGADLAPGSVAIGSAKSNIGHLKAAAGAAGFLKAVLAIHHKELPPSLHVEELNPNIDWAESPFRVNTELRPWDPPTDGVRTAGVSAFGFGGTNFHIVLEEHVPGRLPTNGHNVVAVGADLTASTPVGPVGAGAAAGTTAAGAAGPAAAVAPVATVPTVATVPDTEPKAPQRGALVLGADDEPTLVARLRAVQADAVAGRAPAAAPPAEADLRAPERVAIDYADAGELAEKAAQALAAFEQPARWKVLRGRGIFRGSGPAPKVAFLYTGQGSQYANMLAALREVEPVVAKTFDEADAVMTPFIGRPLTSYLFADAADPEAVAAAEADLRRTEITQPAVLTVDLALTRLLAAYGIVPDLVMGHSLGEYGALVAAGALTFDAALEAVSARGREMAHLTVEDNGAMAAVFAPLEEIEQIVAETDGYVVVANVNSSSQAVIGGATAAVGAAVARCEQRGFQTAMLPVSHAFHTSIVAPASEPLRRTLERLDIQPPQVPIVANVTGSFYPMGPNVVPEMLDLLAAQVAAPVQFVKGLRTLYDAGARVFVEVGPKKALQGFATDVLSDDVVALATNHPKLGDATAFNQGLCGLYAAGVGVGHAGAPTVEAAAPTAVETSPEVPVVTTATTSVPTVIDEVVPATATAAPADEIAPAAEPVVITGAALGLPGAPHVFDDANVARILHGEQGIDVIPTRIRHEMVDRHITRLVKGDGGARFETIDSPADVVKLAGRAGEFDLGAEFGVDPDRIPALGRETQLAMAAGIDALRDAGIPLVQHFRTTTVGTQLPDGWVLPDEMRESTGVIFASAFPGYNDFADEVTRFGVDAGRREQLAALAAVRAKIAATDGHGTALAEIDRRIEDLERTLEHDAYAFDRRFLFRVLSMGHSQFAELIGARGPNTQVNAACASTTQAIAVAEDWIRAGRCERVIVVAADDVTSDVLLGWMGSGFLASGAAATDENVEEAAVPFDRRRHGMILGMGAAALVVETAEAARQRGIRPICEVLGAVTANSAFHGTRLDVDHIGRIMESVVVQAEARGAHRDELAPATVFISHETYTPARGGSAAAEVNALRQVFGAAADQIVVANTKGFTGHPMGVGIEDVVAVKALETGIVPPVPNFKEPDPDLGPLNLSIGGVYPVRYALRLAAGFGSQISMVMLGWVPSPDGQRPHLDALGYAGRIADAEVWDSWLARVSGDPDPHLEVDHRTLRVGARDVAAAAPPPTAEPVTARAVTPVPMVEPAASVAPVAPVVEEPAPPAEPVAPAVTPAAAEPPVVAPVPSGEDLAARVVALVAEQTGYPPELLDLDLDLEADLGIDTVKQAELFAQVRETYGIERDESLKLRDYPTLNHVIGFVRDRTPQPTTTPEPAPTATAQSPTVTTAASPPVVEEAAVAAPVAAPFPSGEDVAARVVALVAEQTGYPPELLDLDLDLEADLGIDTVKQAELFAQVRETYGIERDESLQLRDYPTLNHVIGFVRDRMPQPTAADPVAATAPAETTVTTVTTVTTAAAPAPAEAPADDAGFPRRVPVPVVRPPLDWFPPTGVRLEAGSRVVILPDRGGVAEALSAALAGRGVEVLRTDAAGDSETVAAQVAAWLAAGRVDGLYALAGLDNEAPIADLDLDAWHDGLHRRVKVLGAATRALYDALGDGGSFLVAATRNGGAHGYDESGARSAMAGAVSGFTKAIARERPGAAVKVVDMASSAEPAEVAGALVDETLHDAGVVEIGRRGTARLAIGIEERRAPAAEPARALGPGSVVVATGAAGSIVSAIVADLARAAGGGTFHLLDLIPAPDPADPDLAAFADDRDGLKRQLAARIAERGERATPVLIERELAAIERRCAARAAIDAVTAAGGTAHWYAADLRDGQAMGEAAAAIRAASERVDVLLHAGGLEISRLLPDKSPAEFDLVFDVKSDGWFHLLHSLGDTPIGAAVVFSSIAGRFGNGGQSDYSAANDLLCKSVSSFRTTRPATRGVAIDWTAWADIGMATRGSIPKVMAAAGIDMLPSAIGIPVVRREVTAGGSGGEIVVAGALGVMLETPGAAPATSGTVTVTAPTGAGPMVGQIEVAGGDVVVLTELDPAAQPFLDHHRIDGTPVLPGVMGMEAFAEAAGLLAPGWHVTALEDVEFLAPFKWYRDEPRRLEVHVRAAPDGDRLVADCRLDGRRTLPGQPQRVTTHFTGRVVLSPAASDLGTVAPPPDPAGPVVKPADIYRVYFHGPAYQVLAGVWRAGDSTVGELAGDLPVNHTGGALVAAPRLVELCFQTAGVAAMAANGALGLPRRVRRVEVAADASEGAARRAIVTAGDAGAIDAVDAVVVDSDGRVLVRLTGYETVALPGAGGADLIEPFTAALR